MLSKSLRTLKGVGDKTYQKLNKLGLYTFKDAIYNFPRNYIDKSNVKKIVEFSDMEFGTIAVKIESVNIANIYGKKNSMLKLRVFDSSMNCEIIFFNAKYLGDKFNVGDEFYFFGQIKTNGRKRVMTQPDYINYYDDNVSDFLSIQPIYSLTKSVTQKEINKIQRRVVKNNLQYISETLPNEIRMKNELVDISIAIKNIHFPESERGLKLARNRLVYEELFKIQVFLFAIKNRIVKTEGAIIPSVDISDLLEKLPFKLTDSQISVIEDISVDLASNKTMNRLLQGDVGSGKTVVALVAMVLSAKANYQSVLMAPTEVLARQHYDFFVKYAGEYGVELLSSSSKKKDVYFRIATGESKIIIGTHALIQRKVEYFNLGLVITDEQHRFGVRQRDELIKKGKSPNVLIMTATPIPRTLSLILYGDVDISVIKHMPIGRKPISTHYIKKHKREAMYDFIAQKMEQKQQVYFICPLIEDSEVMDLTSVQTHYEKICKKYPKFKVGMLHGNMKPLQKQQIMQDFKDRKIDILVATTVIEVGIDVPNATIMVIIDSDRFGLAQLHQLRGRVGRGELDSYCFLISNNLTKIATERINIMTKSTDGFEIADKDLQLRGSGEIFGVKQHGIPELKIANLPRDIDILNSVQNDVKDIFENYSKSKLEKFLDNYIGDTKEFII